ncbi:unnamed protein product [Chrysoparadoxa australica]
MPVGGRLIFKGGEEAVSLKAKKKAKKKAKEAKRKRKAEEQGRGQSTSIPHGPSQQARESGAAPAEEEEFILDPITGTGRITTSGTAVTGYNTNFLSELSVGDAIIIQHPTSLVEETRIIKMVLSKTSMGLSSPFSGDLMSSTTFRYIKPPKQATEDDGEAGEGKRRKLKTKEEDAAFGTYAGEAIDPILLASGGTKVVYRVKKAGAFGGYQIVTESADSNMSREELLDLRSGKKADRHC